ncbi:coagulation factor XI-like [Pelobates fuscus]|uniref:coagulation factor XI-like n=1 Tax=Pelobates fuscus TaxID=191477 RepID=UPI002FE492FF
MHIILILLHVPLLWSCPQDNPSGGDTPLLPSVDFPGGDIVKIPSPDESACRILCTHHPECDFFSYHSRKQTDGSRSFTCHLKTSDTGIPNEQVPNPDVTSGYSLTKIPDSLNRCLAESYEDIEFVGNVLSFGPVGSLDECQLACTRNPGCQFYTYYSSTNTESGIQPRCYLQYFTNLPSPAMITATPEAQSGFSQKDCCTGGACSYGCDDLIFPDIFFSGTVISSLKAFDVAVCQQACNQNSECQFFTYSLHQSSWCMCYLKQSDSGLPDNVTSVISQYSGFNNQSSEKGLLSCADLLVSDLEYEGVSVLEEEVQSSHECQQLCTNHALCQFFTVLPTDTGNGKSICYLKNAPGNIPTMVTARPTAVSGFSMDYNSMKKGVQSCTSLLYPNMGFSGTDVGQVLVSDAESCRISCTQSPDCKYFTFYGGDWNVIEDRYTCHMKSSLTGSPDFISLAPNATSGFPINATTYVDCSTLLLKDSMFTGTLIGYMMAPDALQCQHLCTQTPLCQFFTHFSIDWMLDERRFYCFLQRGDGGNPSSIISLLNATSGFSESLSGLQRECITEMYDGVDFPGSDERSLNAKSFEECRSLCTADPICQFFTFFNQTFLTPDQTNTCYLKSLLLVPLPEIIRHSPGVVSGYPQRNCNGKIPDYPDYVLPSC